jgi:hypothetical protein
MSMGHWRRDSDGPPCLPHRTVRLSLGFPLSLLPYGVRSSIYNLKSRTPNYFVLCRFSAYFDSIKEVLLLLLLLL